MQDIRRAVLQALLAGPPYHGDRQKFCAKAEIKNSYLSQLLLPHYSFGERAARRIEQKLELEPLYFDRPVYAAPPAASVLSVAEQIAHYRAMPADQRELFLLELMTDRKDQAAATVVGQDEGQPTDRLQGGHSKLADFDDQPAPAIKKTKKS